jgi:hypothetical protein
MQVVQTTAPTESQIKVPFEELPHHFPVPVGEIDPNLPRELLHGTL